MPGLRQAVDVLRRQLRIFHVNKKVDFHGLLQGNPSAFVELYRYILCDHCVEISSFLLDNKFLLSGTSEFKFMETVYRICRDVLNMKPVLSLAQFFTKSFTEKKLIMAADLIKALVVLKRDIESRLPEADTLRLSHSSSARPGALRKFVTCANGNASDETAGSCVPIGLNSNPLLEAQNARPSLKSRDEHKISLDSRIFVKPVVEFSAISVVADDDTDEIRGHEVSKQGDSFSPQRLNASDRDPRVVGHMAAGECRSIELDQPESARVSLLLASITNQMQSLVKRLDGIESRVSSMESDRRLSRHLFDDENDVLDHQLPEVNGKFLSSNSSHVKNFEQKDGGSKYTTTVSYRNIQHAPMEETMYKTSIPTNSHVIKGADDADLCNQNRPLSPPISSSSRVLETYPRISIYSGDTIRPLVSAPYTISQVSYSSSVVGKAFLAQSPADTQTFVSSRYQQENGIERNDSNFRESMSGPNDNSIPHTFSELVSSRPLQHTPPTSDGRIRTASTNSGDFEKLSSTRNASFQNSTTKGHNKLPLLEDNNEYYVEVSSAGNAVTKQVDRINSMLTETQRLLNKGNFDSKERMTSKNSLAIS